VIATSCVPGRVSAFFTVIRRAGTKAWERTTRVTRECSALHSIIESSPEGSAHLAAASRRMRGESRRWGILRRRLRCKPSDEVTFHGTSSPRLVVPPRPRAYRPIIYNHIDHVWQLKVTGPFAWDQWSLFSRKGSPGFATPHIPRRASSMILGSPPYPVIRCRAARTARTLPLRQPDRQAESRSRRYRERQVYNSRTAFSTARDHRTRGASGRVRRPLMVPKMRP